VSQPQNRECQIPVLGEIDHAAGEFWVENPLWLPEMRKNLSAYERNRMYLNFGGESFVDVSYASGADIDSDSRSVIAADFNNDGSPDLLVGSAGGGPLRLFYNRFPDTVNRLQIKLAGSTSNRSAIGARVTVFCGGRQLVRDVFPANGFMGMSPTQLTIGIGQAKTVDRIVVRWPSGQVQEFANVPVNQRISITEGEPSFR